MKNSDIDNFNFIYRELLRTRPGGDCGQLKIVAAIIHNADILGNQLGKIEGRLDAIERTVNNKNYTNE